MREEGTSNNSRRRHLGNPTAARRVDPFLADADFSTLEQMPPEVVIDRLEQTWRILDDAQTARWCAFARRFDDAPAWAGYAGPGAVMRSNLELARLRSEAFLVGWEVESELPTSPLVGDRLQLVARFGEHVVTLTWTFTGQGRGVRRSGSRSTPRGVRTVPYSAVAAQLTADGAPAQAPGCCTCCQRTPPPEAQLPRSPRGLCFGCNASHLAQQAWHAPDARCNHAPRWAPEYRRWWRSDPATDPALDNVEEWARPLGLEDLSGSDGLRLAYGLNDPVGEPDEVIGFSHDCRTGDWEARRERHPGLQGRPRRPEVVWRLDAEISRHELAEVLELLRAGEVALPERYAPRRRATGARAHTD